MQIGTVNNFGLIDSSSFQRSTGLEPQVSHAGLLQRIAETLIKEVHTERTLTEFAAKLTSIAEHAYSARQLDVVGYLGELLSRLPLARQKLS